MLTEPLLLKSNVLVLITKANANAILSASCNARIVCMFATYSRLKLNIRSKFLNSLKNVE